MTVGLFAVTAVPPANGDGSSGSPYEISSIDNLYWIKQNATTWNKYFIQIADIDASASSTMHNGDGWKPIGPFPSDSLFTGHYDGQGYAIEGLYINRPTLDYMGLFGEIWNSSSEIKNIHMTNVNITGKNYVGAIVGVGYMKMNNCSSTGSITGDQRTGGLAGTIANGSPMNNCNSSVNVTGSYYTGGLVGGNESNMQKCYSTGTVSGGNYTGGIAGNNMFSITNCYSIADVSGSGYVGGIAGNNSDAIKNSYFAGSINGTSDVGGLVGYSDDMMGMPDADKCFWNSDTISTGIARGFNFGTIYGKTTTELKIQTTYTAVGWDFSGIWSMDNETNNNYPYLQDNVPTEVPLPITLTDFTAIFEKGVVILNWETASETNNACFLIYRNGDIIGTIEGAGTSSGIHYYSFQDKEVTPGNTYTYMLADLSYANEEDIYENLAVTVSISENNFPLEFILKANYPNPFNPFTVIPYALTSDGYVELSIYNVSGQLVRTLIDGSQAAGYHKIIWDSRDNAGNEVNSGIYISRITAGDLSDSRKMLLIK